MKRIETETQAQARIVELLEAGKTLSCIMGVIYTESSRRFGSVEVKRLWRQATGNHE